MKLIIVESPGKIKTISKILGPDYVVKASIGHCYMIDPKDNAIDIENNYTPRYVPIPKKSSVISDLKSLSAKAEVIYLSSDADREGEAISFHIYNNIIKDKDKSKVKRIRFNEITKSAILAAIKAPSTLDENLFHAQQARSVLDFLCGFKVSPVLWKKVCRGTSAGRVQSIGLRMIVERQKEINAFKPDEYWSIQGIFSSGVNQTIDTDYVIDGKITNDKDAQDRVTSILKESSWKIDSIKKSSKKQTPAPLFITSSMQQFCSSCFGWDGKRTMSIAQKLYEGFPINGGDPVGLITYHRTDSVNVSKEAMDSVRDFISDNFGCKYLPESPRYYKSSNKSSQDAHEGIRPSHLEYSLKDIRNSIPEDEYKLYEVIYSRFISSQMTDAEFDTAKILIKSGEHTFSKTGQILTFDGFLTVWHHSKTKDEELPDLIEGSNVALIKVAPEQHFTKPPAFFNTASLVKALEEKGIGRPSTYASIVDTLITRAYVTKKDKAFIPSELGCKVSDFLVGAFPELMDSNFTARIEEELDEIAEKGSVWYKTVDQFYKEIAKRIIASKDIASLKTFEETEIVCPTCKKHKLTIRSSRYGKFYGCAGYMEKGKEKCRATFRIGEEGVPIKSEKKYMEGKTCPKCGAKIVIRKSKRTGKEFGGCDKFPKCRTMFTMEGEVIEPKYKRFGKKKADA